MKPLLILHFKNKKFSRADLKNIKSFKKSFDNKYQVVVVSGDNIDVHCSNSITLDISNNDDFGKFINKLNTFHESVDDNKGYESIFVPVLNPTEDYIRELISDINLDPDKISTDYILELANAAGVDPMLFTEIRYDPDKFPWVILDENERYKCHYYKPDMYKKAAELRNKTRNRMRRNKNDSFVINSSIS